MNLEEAVGPSFQYASWPARETAIESGDMFSPLPKSAPSFPSALRFNLHDWIDTADFSQ